MLPLRRCFWSTLLLPALAVAACAIVDGTESGSLFGRTAAGYFSLGFEDSTFLPCSTAESWWVESAADVPLGETYQRVSSGSYDRVYAVLQGDLSRPGVYGHLGAYRRAFRVTKIVEMRKATPDDCTWPGDKSTGS